MLSFDIQAVVFAAGRGSRMTQLIGSSIPKCLLPVAGNPLILYPLQFLANNGFQGKDILIIIQENRDDVKKIVEKIADKLKLTVDYLMVPDSEEFGTYSSLKLAFKSNKIQRELLLLLSCDTISDVPLLKFINYHQSNSSDFTCLFVKHLETQGKLPGPKIKLLQEKDIVGINPLTSQLFFLASQADFEDTLNIPIKTLKIVPNMKIYTLFQDTHIYLIKKFVLKQFLGDGKEVNFKGEFIPKVIKSQEEEEESKKVNIFAFIYPEAKSVRVNNIPSFSAVNKSIDWVKKLSIEISLKTPQGDTTPSLQLLPTGRGDRSTKIPKSAKIQNSTIGDNCKIGEGVKIVNSIILDNVIVEEEVSLENCIVSLNAKIGSKSIIKDCLIGPDFQVSSEGRHQNETLTVLEETYFDS